MKQGSNRFAMDSLDLEGSSVKTKDAEDDKNIESDWKEQGLTNFQEDAIIL